MTLIYHSSIWHKTCNRISEIRKQVEYIALTIHSPEQHAHHGIEKKYQNIEIL